MAAPLATGKHRDFGALAPDWRAGLVVATDGRAPADVATAAARALAGDNAFTSMSIPSPLALSQFAPGQEASLVITSIGEPCVLQRLQ
ncbi:MAG: hypothetical protein ABI442_15145 [Gemmatimonadaceae bacterium]